MAVGKEGTTMKQVFFFLLYTVGSILLLIVLICNNLATLFALTIYEMIADYCI